MADHKPGGVAAKVKQSDRWWDDAAFQDNLVALLVKDNATLEKCAPLLSPEDFRPGKGAPQGRARWIVAERALEFFEKHHKPLGDLLRSNVLAYAAQLDLGASHKVELEEYAASVVKLKPVAPDAIVEKVIEFKRHLLDLSGVEELVELQASGTLTPEKWTEIYQRVLAGAAEPETPQVAQWPEKLAAEAFHGLAGDVVREIEPDTESDPAALLVQFLLTFGNVIGRHAYWQVEADRHYLNLFAVLVGKTSKARKGTSLNRVLNLFEEIDAKWILNRRMGGLSSGEGLIKEVRDPVLRLNKAGEEVGDKGEPDKRLLITEPEFARVLKVGEREAATLPSILRDAWDRGELRTMTKESPLRATAAHISLIAHITEEELKRTLSDTNRANGFANRFLWVCVHRSKLLPLGGVTLKPEVRRQLIERLRKAVHHAGNVRRVVLGTRATPLWRRVYRELSEGEPGMFGAATDRAEAQVRRIACLYALLDGESFVREEHLRAALAVWRYCLDSARHLFGQTVGDPVADAILKELRKRGATGMSRNEIRTDLFQQNKSSEAIGHALLSLQKRGLVQSRSISREGAGRPTERWYVV